MNKKTLYTLPALIIISVIFVSGCTTDTNSPIGGERDEHGCLGPAGYSWDSDVGACIRSWELDDNQKRAASIAVDYAGEAYANTVTEVLTARCPGCFTVKIDQGEEREEIVVTLQDWEVVQQGSDGIDRYYVDYADGNVTYNITVAKPSPCHYLNVTKRVLESYPVQVMIDVVISEPEEGTMCAQVVTEETLTGKIGTGSRPASVTVNLDGSAVYQKEFETDRHYCTDEEKAAQMCTMEYNPVCGWSNLSVSKTYGNACMACAAGVEYYESGECLVEGMSPQECIDLGGRTVNTVGGDACYENETNAGDVQGFISPNICCVPN